MSNSEVRKVSPNGQLQRMRQTDSACMHNLHFIMGLISSQNEEIKQNHDPLDSLSTQLTKSQVQPSIIAFHLLIGISKAENVGAVPLEG